MNLLKHQKHYLQHLFPYLKLLVLQQLHFMIFNQIKFQIIYLFTQKQHLQSECLLLDLLVHGHSRKLNKNVLKIDLLIRNFHCCGCRVDFLQLQINKYRLLNANKLKVLARKLCLLCGNLQILIQMQSVSNPNTFSRILFFDHSQDWVMTISNFLLKLDILLVAQQQTNYLYQLLRDMSQSIQNKLMTFHYTSRNANSMPSFLMLIYNFQLNFRMFKDQPIHQQFTMSCILQTRRKVNHPYHQMPY